MEHLTSCLKINNIIFLIQQFLKAIINPLLRPASNGDHIREVRVRPAKRFLIHIYRNSAHIILCYNFNSQKYYLFLYVS